MLSIGQLYEKGLGVSQDYIEAMKWYKMAVEEGNSDSMMVIGDLYRDGLGVPKDITEAEKWYKMADAAKD
jgi:TPR repeat protein